MSFLNRCIHLCSAGLLVALPPVQPLTLCFGDDCCTPDKPCMEGQVAHLS